VFVSQGQTVQRPFTVSPSLLEVAVQSGWSSGDIQISLISPSGRVVDRTTDAPDVLHPGTINSFTLVVKHPDTGNWTIQVFGAAVPGSGEQVGFSVIQIPLSDFAPVAYVGASVDRGVAPLSIHFDTTASGFQGATITSYRWDFGDCSAPDSTPRPTHIFTAAGTFAVAVTVTDSNGQTDTADREILVTAYNHAPTADFLWGLLDSSKPTMVSLDGETSKDIDGQVTGFAWDFGDGSTGNGKLVAHTYTKAGSYPVRLTVTDDGGLTASICQLVTTGVSLGGPVPCHA
jgi:PKD repeat protein